jgi:diguanylate cyclase (GGDEF)-like protein
MLQVVSLEARDRSWAAVNRLPCFAAVLLAWVAVPIGSSLHWGSYDVATGMLALIAMLGCVRPVRRWNETLGQAPVSVAFLAAVALLRQAGGGSTSGAAILTLVAVFYTALYGNGRRPLYIVLAAVALFYLVPILLIGPPPYPHAQYRAALLTVAVSSLIGLTTQRLVAGVRDEAAAAGGREQMHERIGVVVRTLFASPEPRTDICRAAVAISDATVAILFEPDTTSGVLRCTATAGTDPPDLLPAIASGGPVAIALRSGRGRLLSEPITRAVAGAELSDACGQASSILLQPLLRGGTIVGVLVVAWPADVVVDARRETVVELLAHEAALVIDRADELSLLVGMAETDPLTGLPNRRAWDARLSRVTADDERVTVAMFDIDHFKRFNDAHGHLAGDELLRETAAAWRLLLRPDDLLARVGGEEFGLLLVSCSPSAAAEVTERLRLAVTGGQTASAGLAVRHPGEPLESVLGRADHALYDAKAYGRDHVRAAA